MEPIRILHIVGVMNRGGAETLLMELYRHIDTTKVQFDFLVYNYTNQPGAYDEEIISRGGRLFFATKKFYQGPVAFCLELYRFFKQHPEYRIVHIHQYAPSGYMAAMAKKANRNCVTIAHSHSIHTNTAFLRNVSEKISKKLLKKNADFIFGCSKDAIELRFSQSPDNQRFFVVNNAIDVKKYAFDITKRTQWRKTFGADDKTVIIGNVARFSEEKNHRFIVEIFDCFTKLNSDCRLVFVGDGEKRQEIEQLVREKDLVDKVYFLGVRDDVNEILNAFDVFILPSQFEGLGIVLIEAQANGLPCVISSGVIPQEADVGAELVTRVGLEEPAFVWAKACVDVQSDRCESQFAQQSVIKSGYEIGSVTNWLEYFYLSYWSKE